MQAEFPALPNESTLKTDSSLNIEGMRTASQHVATILRTLANEDRLLLLCQLSQGERSVSELEDMLQIRQPTLSQQLGVLRTEGVVKTRREGKRIYYSIEDSQILIILKTLYTLYCPV